MITLNLYIYS